MFPEMLGCCAAPLFVGFTFVPEDSGKCPVDHLPRIMLDDVGNDCGDSWLRSALVWVASVFESDHNPNLRATV